MRQQLSLLTTVATALLAAGAGAQVTPLAVAPESKVIILGKSNVNSWSCATSAFVTSVDVGVGPRRDTSKRVVKPDVGLWVTVPVRSLECGRNRMNQDLYRTLKADSFPEIRFVLASYRALQTLVVPDSFWVTAVGDLTVAGKTKTVEVKLGGERESNGDVRAEGGVKLLMTDFGISPPTALFGFIRTKNAIEVNVKVLVVSRDLAALAPSVARQPTDSSRVLRILVSVAERRLLVVNEANDTLRTATVAVGSDRTIRNGDSTWTFTTPRGATNVVAREVNPVWIPPDWHYVEIAHDSGLALAQLREDRPVRLGDGRLLVVRSVIIGVIGPDSVFREVPADQEIVFDGTLFVPPFGPATAAWKVCWGIIACCSAMALDCTERRTKKASARRSRMAAFASATMTSLGYTSTCHLVRE